MPVALVPIAAVVCEGASTIATAGLTETLPLEPALASVVTPSVASEVASTVTSSPPRSVAPSSISARVTLTRRMFRATETPTPTLSLPVVATSAFAFVTSVRVVSATIETSPVPAWTLTPLRTSASVLFSTMLIATDPATPMFWSPTPAVVSAPKVCRSSPPTFVISASTTSPLPPIVVTPVVARFVTKASVSATAAAMPTSLEPPPPPLPVPSLSVSGLPTAWPSAFAVASVFAEVRSVTAPPAVTVIPSARKASELVSAIVIAIAAATLTEPLEVLASVCCEPEPWPPFAVAWPSAAERSCATCWLTSPLGAPLSPSPGAPAALAVASLLDEEEPSAWKLIESAASSPASIERAVEAVTEWFA